VAVHERIDSYLPDVTISEKTQKDTPVPYIELYDISSAGDLSTKCSNIKELRVTIRVYDESENADTVKGIVDDIVYALTASKLELEGAFNCYLTTHERSEPSVLLKDAKTWRGIAQFLCSVVQTS
jgi:predicted transcriptional regulator